MAKRKAEECWKELKRSLDIRLLHEIEQDVIENQASTTVVFGTSGWRGEIGSDYTFRNLQTVTQAIINILRRDDPELRNALGVRNFREIQDRGLIIGHDNRFYGPEFARVVMGMFAAEGIKLYYAGETTTPEISASIEMVHAACGVNITPSHNPSNYQGLKFNPSDGGPAGSEITGPVQDEANRLMKSHSNFSPLPDASGYERIDTTAAYIDYIRDRKTLDLEKIRKFIREEDCLIVIDHVHGATRGRPERIFDLSPDEIGRKVIFLRKEDDYLFGGVAPEPSSANMKEAGEILRKSRARFRLGAIMDPDGDRIRFADPGTQIPMNYFGAMALHFLHQYKGIKGVAVKSVGTSNFVNAIAERHGILVRETEVGFKNFRPYMLKDSSERAIVAFEESDGISAFNHTLEKDALFGLMLAVEMMAATGKNLGDYLDELMTNYGYYYPDRSGIEVDQSLTGDSLKKRLSVIQAKYPKGSRICIEDKDLKVIDVITVDGTKIVLEDGSWLMIRPSGTEPKVRFYIEARTPEEKQPIFNTARRLTEEALKSDLE